MNLPEKSEAKLRGVHPDLCRVVRRAALITVTDEFIVTEGLRSIERQKVLYDSGKSKTMKSRHLTGHAIDLAAIIAGGIVWDWPCYVRLAALMKKAAADENVPLEWGGDWETFKDGPHFQLPWKDYP